MCNYTHEDSKPIPPEGLGWKIFDTVDGVLVSCFKQRSYFNKGYPNIVNNVGIEWRNHFDGGDGFCFFRTRKEARRALRVLKNDFGSTFSGCVIRRIAYRGGLGEHTEKGMVFNHSFSTCIATWFKVIPGRA